MTGITDEKHIVEAGLALCAALRTVCSPTGEAAELIDNAEAHFNAVRTPAKAKTGKDKEKPSGDD